MEAKAMKTAVIGCGVISEIYLSNMINRFDNLQVVACCDIDQRKAQIRAQQFGIPSRSLQEILSDPGVELVVILTPPVTHYELIRQALQAGKHVYTEKTMTVELWQAQDLVAIAREKDLYLGAAPDTFLCAAFQKARQMLEAGDIGDVTSFDICVNRNIDFLASRFRFLRQPGGGICYDYGVYYLTVLVYLLGAADSVFALVENGEQLRTNVDSLSEEYGQTYRYDNESKVAAILKLKNGVSGTFAVNGESIVPDLGVFTIYGTKGVLKLANPGYFGSEIRLITADETYEAVEETVENDLPYSDNSRGLGPSEMVDAIREGRPNAASKELAYHVLEIIDCMMRSSKEKTYISVKSDCK